MNRTKQGAAHRWPTPESGSVLAIRAPHPAHPGGSAGADVLGRRHTMVTHMSAIPRTYTSVSTAAAMSPSDSSISIAAGKAAPKEPAMSICTICRFATELDDVAVTTAAGRCICLCCFSRETGSTRTMPKTLQHKLRTVLAALEPA